MCTPLAPGLGGPTKTSGKKFVPKRVSGGLREKEEPESPEGKEREAGDSHHGFPCPSNASTSV